MFKRIFIVLILIVICLYSLNGISSNNMLCEADKLFYSKEFKKAFNKYFFLANKGNYYAQYMIGLMYYNGQGVTKDYKEAYKWLEKSSTGWFAPAMCLLGIMYQNGLGVTKDYNMARIYYENVIQQEDENNITIEVDYENNPSLGYSISKNRRGIGEAQNNLALLYMKGLGVKQNAKKAFSLLKDSTNNKFALAQLSLSVCYLEGIGTKRNNINAFKWCHEAAKQGPVTAEYNLGLYYLQGIGTDKSFDDAVKWLSLASKKDYTLAENELAFILAENDKDLAQAEKLIKQALQKEPDKPEFVDTYGYILYKQKKYKEAVEQFNKALKKLPSNKEIKQHLTDAENALSDSK